MKVNKAVAFRVDRREVISPFFVFHIHNAIAGEEHTIATIACRHYAVEHIHSTFDAFEQIGWSAYSHQISWFVFWQYVVYHLNHFIHFFGRFAYGKTADGITFTTLVGNEFSRFSTQFGIYTALNDREESLTITIFVRRRVEAFQSAFQPTVSAFHRVFGIFIVCRTRCALVECHHNISANSALNINHILWREEVFRPIYVRTEYSTFFGELAIVCQRKHLETTTICEDWAIPTIEFVQTACLFQNIKSRTEIEMICIAKNDLSLDVFFHLFDVHAFD